MAKKKSREVKTKTGSIGKSNSPVGNTLVPTPNSDKIIELTRCVEDLVKTFRDGQASETGGMRSVRWEGPLPPQMFQNLTDEHRTMLIQDTIRNREKQQDIQEKLIEAEAKAQSNRTKISLVQMIIIGLLVPGLSCLFLLTNNSQLLVQLIPLLSVAFGGGGIAVLYFVGRRRGKTAVQPGEDQGKTD